MCEYLCEHLCQMRGVHPARQTRILPSAAMRSWRVGTVLMPPFIRNPGGTGTLLCVLEPRQSARFAIWVLPGMLWQQWVGFQRYPASDQGSGLGTWVLIYLGNSSLDTASECAGWRLIPLNSISQGGSTEHDAYRVLIAVIRGIVSRSTMLSWTDFFTAEHPACNFPGSREIMLSFQEFWTVEFLLLKTPYPRACKAEQAWDPLLRVTFFNAKNKTHRITKETNYAETKCYTTKNILK